MILEFARATRIIRTLEHNSYPNSVYTTSRSFDNKSVFLLKDHIQRLLNGSLLANIPYTKEDDTIIKSLIKQHVTEYNRYTIYINAQYISVQFSQVKLPPPYVSVIVANGERKYSNIKSSEWIEDRKKYEVLIKGETNEVVLEKDQQLYEGLSSNFYIVKNNTLYTAPLDKVLPGTIQKLVCKITPIIFDFPCLNEIQEWESAFISSTSRLLLPIKTIYLLNGDKLELKIKSEFISNLMTKLENEIQSNSDML